MVYKKDSYWWIDYCCVDQNNSSRFIAALPLYIASSVEVISAYIPGSDYDKRGWIRCDVHYLPH